MSVFARFAPRLQQAIVARLGWSSLRPVQEQAGEALLAGRNAVILAPTAGGKTEASMFPALSQMVDDEPEGVGVIYIAPIKALLNNQAQRLGLYTEMVGLRRFVWHGDVGSHLRKKFLADPAELLMTTPESLEVMLVSQRVDEARLFGDLRMVVIDEIHAVAGTDRGAHLMSVLERIARVSRHDVQRVGLSATVGNPTAILGWLAGTSGREGVVVDPPKPQARRELLVIHGPEREELSRQAAVMARGLKSLFFCQSRRMSESVAEQMRRSGTSVFVHHSSVSKEEREHAEEQFHKGGDACIVCTSTLELGIDVGDLDRVLQAEAPDTVSSFLQRMGRTGRRAGKAANTSFFCESSEGVLQAIALVELAREGWVEHVSLTDRCWPVLVHQLLVMALAANGIPPEEAWAHLSTVPDLAGIRRAEFDRLTAFMVRDRSLVEASGRLILGPKAEKKFGRRHFMELYAVFSSPRAYSVVTAEGRPVGTLNQDFVDRLAEEVSSFLLGGRAWYVSELRHDDRLIKVKPAPRGKQPTWGGFLPQFLGFELCQRIRQLLVEDGVPRYLHPTAVVILGEEREAHGETLRSARHALEVDDGELRWWTFAGGRINGTLKHLLKALDDSLEVVPDNYRVRIRGEGLGWSDFEGWLAKLREPELWEDDALWKEIAEGLPNYRLSKFQPLVPPWVEREMVASHLLDVQGTWRWLTGAVGEGASEVERMPASLQRALQTARGPSAEVAATADDGRTAYPRPTLPVRWVRDDAGLAAACAALRSESAVGLDVETTLGTNRLCLVQIAGAGAVTLIDPFEVTDFAPLAELVADGSVTKIIHHADFEREVLGGLGMRIEGVYDTLVASRERHGREVEGGHSLKAVCRRELGMELDKAMQTSDWTLRPLTERQVAYAAVDAEVLLGLASVVGMRR